jgi:hypothetical protein
VLTVAIASVYPSARALFTCIVPIAPTAPPTFSTMTDWPRSRLNWSAARRPMMSVLPPGAKGTTILIGREGQVWADDYVD